MLFGNAKCISTARLDGKTAIVTGSNTGIGRCTVQDFYKRGAHVIMACRNLEKAKQAAESIQKECKRERDLGSIMIMKLDLSSLKSIREFANEINENETSLDLLVNNAGVMMCPKGKTTDGFETQFGTNHLGPFLLTLLLLPKIIESASARIVNVSSVAHTMLSGSIRFDDLNWERRSYSSKQAYYQSKLANVLFTKELARRLQEAKIDNVTTYALHPGIIATDLWQHLNDTIVGGDWMYRNIVTLFMKTPEQGAQTTIYCSVDENVANETGLYYAECKIKNSSSKSKSVKNAKKLWEISWNMVGLDSNYNPFSDNLITHF